MAVGNRRTMTMAYRYLTEGSIDTATLRAVWAKGQTVSTHDANVYRKDVCGNWMQFSQHGKEGDYGWEVDHIKPLAKQGADTLANMQPLQWANNRRKSDIYPWSCT